MLRGPDQVRTPRVLAPDRPSGGSCGVSLETVEIPGYGPVTVARYRVGKWS